MTLTVHRGEGRSVLVPLLVLLACAVLGGVDDLLTLVGQAGSGLTVRMKFGCLTVIALAAALAIWLPQGLEFTIAANTAAGRFDIRWDVAYHDYRQADVTTKIHIGADR